MQQVQHHVATNDDVASSLQHNALLFALSLLAFFILHALN